MAFHFLLYHIEQLFQAPVDNAYSPIVGQFALGTPQSCYHISMIGKGVGVLALAAVLGFVSYYETSFLQQQELSAAAPAGKNEKRGQAQFFH